MSREIKFRAWDIRNKRMLPIIQSIHFEPEGDISHPYNCVEFVIPGQAAGYIPLDKIILMQFTGLKDKNGKGVYEGDITNFGEVEWDNDDLQFKFGKIDIQSYDTKNYPLKVIGNIHETPELLKK